MAFDQFQICDWVIRENRIWLTRMEHLHKPEIPKLFLEGRTPNAAFGHGVSKVYATGSNGFANIDSHSKGKNIENDFACPSEQGHRQEVPVEILNKIIQLLRRYPEGLLLEKLNNNYRRIYGKPLCPFDYGFPDMVDLLQSLAGAISIEESAQGQVFLKVKEDEYKATAEEQVSGVPLEVKEVFQSILKSNQGFCLLDKILHEYKVKTGQILDLTKLGFKSVFEFVAHLDDIAELRKLENGKFAVCDPTCPVNSIPAVLEVTPTDHSKMQQKHKSFEKATVIRIKSLLDVEYPDGLTIEEFLGAYKGLYGAFLTDLDPESYGYRSLEELLRAHSQVVTIQNWGGAVRVLRDQSHVSAEKTIGDQKNSSIPKETVGRGSYKCPDTNALMPPGGLVEVVIGEVYSPNKFWMIHRGVHTSRALNELMDRMLYTIKEDETTRRGSNVLLGIVVKPQGSTESAQHLDSDIGAMLKVQSGLHVPCEEFIFIEFYESPISKRYVVPKAAITMGSPVVAQYSSDLNYYRAIVTCLEDLTTVKLFFVDYGTVCQCDYSALRLIHRSFFDLPAQAIKASLCDVYPTNGGRLWPKTASQRFLEMIQDKALVAQIVSSEKTATVHLWDTNGQEDINIGYMLFTEGFAGYFNKNSFEHSLATPCKTEVPDLQCFSDASSQRGENENLTQNVKVEAKEAIPTISDGTKSRNTSFSSFPEVSHPYFKNTAVSFESGEIPNLNSSPCANVNPNLTDAVLGLVQKINELQAENNALKLLALASGHLGMDRRIGGELSPIPQFYSTPCPTSETATIPDSNLKNKYNYNSCAETDLLSNEGTGNNYVPATTTILTSQVTRSPPPGFAPLPTHQIPVELADYSESKEVLTSSAITNTTSVFYSDESEEITECPPPEPKQLEGVFPVHFKNKYTFHLLCLDGVRYILSKEISSILKDGINLEDLLKERGIIFPSLTITVKSHHDTYMELVRLGANAVYDSTGKLQPTLTVYLLQHFPLMLKYLSNESDRELLSWAESLCDTVRTYGEGIQIPFEDLAEDTKEEEEDTTAQRDEKECQENLFDSNLEIAGATALPSVASCSSETETTAQGDEKECQENLFDSNLEVAGAAALPSVASCISESEIAGYSEPEEEKDAVSRAPSDISNTKELSGDLSIHLEIDDCINKLNDLAKTDARYVNEIKAIELLRSNLHCDPSVKDDIFTLVKFINAIWDQSQSVKENVIEYQECDDEREMSLGLLLQTLRDGFPDTAETKEAVLSEEEKDNCMPSSISETYSDEDILYTENLEHQSMKPCEENTLGQNTVKMTDSSVKEQEKFEMQEKIIKEECNLAEKSVSKIPLLVNSLSPLKGHMPNNNLSSTRSDSQQSLSSIKTPRMFSFCSLKRQYGEQSEGSLDGAVPATDDNHCKGLSFEGPSIFEEINTECDINLSTNLGSDFNYCMPSNILAKYSDEDILCTENNEHQSLKHCEENTSEQNTGKLTDSSFRGHISLEKQEKILNENQSNCTEKSESSTPLLDNSPSPWKGCVPNSNLSNTSSNSVQSLSSSKPPRKFSLLSLKRQYVKRSQGSSSGADITTDDSHRSQVSFETPSIFEEINTSSGTPRNLNFSWSETSGGSSFINTPAPCLIQYNSEVTSHSYYHMPVLPVFVPLYPFSNRI